MCIRDRGPQAGSPSCRGPGIVCDSVDVSPDRSPAVRAAIRQAVSVSIATGLYGVSFGALAVAAGLDLPQTAALSLLLFSGGSQFAFIGVLGSGGAVAAVATAGLLGTRNGLYGPQVAPLLGVHGCRAGATRA